MIVEFGASGNTAKSPSPLWGGVRGGGPKPISLPRFPYAIALLLWGERCRAKRGGVGVPQNREWGSTSFGPVDRKIGPAENDERNSKSKQRLIAIAATRRAGFCSQGSWRVRKQHHFVDVNQVINRIRRFELSSPNHNQVTRIEAYRRVRSRMERTAGYASIHGFSPGMRKRFQEEAPQTSAIGAGPAAARHLCPQAAMQSNMEFTPTPNPSPQGGGGLCNRSAAAQTSTLWSETAVMASPPPCGEGQGGGLKPKQFPYAIALPVSGAC